MLAVQHIASGVLGEVIRRQKPSPARTAFAWSVAVGPALARATTVELRNGVLIVTPKDARWMRELERASETILERLHLLVGPEIQQITIVNLDPRPSNLDPR